MKDKLFKLSFMMMLWWTWEQMLGTDHRQSVIHTIICGVATAINLGFHQDILAIIKKYTSNR